MAHVQISGTSGRTSILVDGVEMGNHILREGFAVDFPDDPEQPITMRCVVEVDRLDIDSPEAVVLATMRGGN